MGWLWRVSYLSICVYLGMLVDGIVAFFLCLRAYLGLVLLHIRLWELGSWLYVCNGRGNSYVSAFVRRNINEVMREVWR